MPSFQISPIGFVNEIIAQVNVIRRELLGGDPPAALFHYTRLSGAEGITNSRIVRAMPVTGLRDKQEVLHGVKLVESEAEKLTRTGVPKFVANVLGRIPEELRGRMSRTFVACFCANPASEFHWKEYGPYCLRFETDHNREPLLRVSVSGAQVGYYRAIYGEAAQQNAVERALKGIVAAINSNTAGTLDGPWEDFSLARNASELLLDVIVAFKRAEFSNDAEWRLAVRPNSALASSAPDLADRNFDVIVRRGEKPHVELQVLRPIAPFYSVSLRSPVPYTAITQSPYCDSAEELRVIQRVLEKNGRGDIAIRKASI
jgi:hypothetical protein